MTTIESKVFAHPFFAHLDRKNISEIAALATAAHFPEERFLFHEGDPATCFFLIVDGKVALESNAGARGTILVETIEAGEALGWSWLFEPFTWHFDARTLQPTYALIFDGVRLRALCKRNPSLGAELITRVAQLVIHRLHEMQMRLLDIYGSRIPYSSHLEARNPPRNVTRGDDVNTIRRAVKIGRASTSVPDEIPERWRWHYRTLVSLRDRLIDERRDQLDEARQPIAPHGMHLADSATDEFDHAFALSQLGAQQSALDEVENAIQRIVAGTYGVCEATGNPIPAARLRAVPWTRFSGDAKAQLERAGFIPGLHLGALRSVPEGAGAAFAMNGFAREVNRHEVSRQDERHI